MSIHHKIFWARLLKLLERMTLHSTASTLSCSCGECWRWLILNHAPLTSVCPSALLSFESRVPASGNSLSLGVKWTLISWQVFWYRGKTKVLKEAWRNRPPVDLDCPSDQQIPSAKMGSFTQFILYRACRNRIKKQSGEPWKSSSLFWNSLTEGKNWLYNFGYSCQEYK